MANDAVAVPVKYNSERLLVQCATSPRFPMHKGIEVRCVTQTGYVQRVQ